MMAKADALPNANVTLSFPIEDADDLKRAIKAGGWSSRDPNRVRQHILKNAKRLNLMFLIPSSWQSDGSLRARRSLVLADSSEELRFRALSIERGFGRGVLARDDTYELEKEWEEIQLRRYRGRVA